MFPPSAPVPQAAPDQPPAPGWPEEDADRYRAAGHWRGETLGRVLRDRAVAHPDRVALVDGPRRWSYARLDAAVDRMAAGLSALGLVPGDRVVVRLPNAAEFFELLLALLRLGALPVLAQPADRDAELRNLCASAEAVALVVGDQGDGHDVRTLASRVRRRVPSLSHVLVAGEPGAHTPLDAVPTDPVRPSHGPRPSDPALLRPSGSSTGAPRLVARTHDDLLHQLRTAGEVSGVDASAVFLCALPAGSTLALSAPGALGTLCAGGRVVVCPHPAPDTAFPLIARERVTHTTLVPPLAGSWIAAATTTLHDLSSLRLLQVGGAPLAERTARRVAPALGCALQQLYTTAEGLVSATRLDDPVETVVTTQGRPLSPDVEARVVDGDEAEVPPGEPGQLLLRGPATVRGYWRAPEEGRFAFTPDGFHRTGDLVRRTERGDLVVVGRVRRQINRGGQQFAPEEVENHLLAHPAVYDARIVGVPDPSLGARVGAQLVARPGATPPSRDVVRAFLRDRGLAEYKIPERVECLPALPHADPPPTPRALTGTAPAGRP
ncbi:2,3-dihydroxybenzoate-AMP ligase [Streptomyces zhaozhouensis]|uniref:2,3-dihydroxybenzoate-AMP ligase n=1 Tax=Streptomyces zhaozhouensis TaxID=1300267 RepID=A0A286DUN7_9ACTN|nr:AMP-binding protein [Streptomyces zhaozhouensis]SOD62274.1 2,3-dihydroxybenzoate-AMP ligase [Streptomyces zhaozhouensis]